ncbi:MAG: M23 family metallopeptidase, partial [Deltaproteobacteria bacterium]|nr:M23 family metallopeptidase [Deltaproteobacteria bacterium]
MKYKFLLIPALVFGLFTVRPAFSFVQDCSEEACEIPSSSQFFLDDANDIPEIDDLSPIATSGQFWPAEGIITGRYGKWRGGRHRGHVHAGVDIAAPVGTNIVAPISGTVAFVGRK